MQKTRRYRGTRLEGGRIASVAVALQISLETVFVRLRFYNVSGPGTVVVEEYHKPFHHGPAHPEIFPVGLMSFAVYHRHRAFIGLYVMAAEHFGHEHIVKRSDKFHRPFVPAHYRGFLQTGHAHVGHNLYLSVEGHVVLVFLEAISRSEGSRAGTPL